MRGLWVAVGLVAMLGGPASRAEAASGEKSGTAAGLLGGLIGLGTGYYYAGNSTKGAIFTVADLGLRGGFLAAAGNDNGGVAGVCFVGMLASAIYQGVDGAAEAGRQNQKRGVSLMGWESPLGFEFGMATMSAWDSGRIETLWANGGADRDRALGASLLRNTRRPHSLSVGLGSDTSVGLGWSTNY